MIEERGLQARPQDRMREYARALPQFAKLIYRLLRDPRVPTRNKTTLALAAAYVVSPIDLLPARFLPGIGRFDDLIVAALALDQIVNQVPPEVVREHWEGERDVLEAVQEILQLATSFLPERVRDLFARFFSPS